MAFSYCATVSPLLELETPPKLAVVIVNPNSGQRKGVKALSIIKKAFGEAGIECKVFETTHAGHCKEICENEDLTGVDILVPIGGDGTLHEACNGLMLRKDGAAERLTIAIVPAGSGNTFAYDIRLFDVEQAIKVATAGKFRKVDVAEIVTVDLQGQPIPGEKPMYSINVVGWALPSKVMKTANAFRPLGCGAWYNFAINKFIFTNDSYAASIIVRTDSGQEETLDMNVSIVDLQNTIHVGSKTPIAPDAKVDDGLLDLVVMTNSSLPVNLRTFQLSKVGKHTNRKQVRMFKCTSVTVIPKDERLLGPNTVNIDGELNGTSPFKATVRPAVLRVFCPA